VELPKQATVKWVGIKWHGFSVHSADFFRFSIEKSWEGSFFYNSFRQFVMLCDLMH